MILKEAHEIAKDIRGANSQNVIFAKLREVVIVLDDRVAELEAKYETTGQKCNNGHVNYLPMKFWDCPICTEKLRQERDALFEACKLIIEERNIQGIAECVVVSLTPMEWGAVRVAIEKTPGIAPETNKSGGTQ